MEKWLILALISFQVFAMLMPFNSWPLSNFSVFHYRAMPEEVGVYRIFLQSKHNGQWQPMVIRRTNIHDMLKRLWESLGASKDEKLNYLSKFVRGEILAQGLSPNDFSCFRLDEILLRQVTPCSHEVIIDRKKFCQLEKEVARVAL